MGIRFKCHHCRAPLNIKIDLADKRGVCPQCQGRFRIPSQSQALSVSLDETAKSFESALPEHESVKSTMDRPGVKPQVVSQATKTSASSDTPTSESETREPLYFVRPPSGGEYGPAAKETIELWISQRRITSETLLCLVGTSNWRKAKEVFSNHFVLG